MKKDAVPVLMQAMASTNADIVWCAITGLGEIGKDAEPSIPLLLPWLDSTNTFVTRLVAVTTLGEIGRQPEIVVPALVLALAKPDQTAPAYVGTFHEATMLALQNYGNAAKPALPQLFKLAEDPDKMTRAVAVETIKKIDPEPRGTLKKE
jgi:hypothetical protein